MLATNAYLFHIWNGLRKNYMKILNNEEQYWFQMAHIKWLEWGNRNTHYFYQSFIVRHMRNKVEALSNDNNQCEYDEEKIKHIVIDHFASLFASEST